MRDGRALIAADIGHARLQDRLGDGKDAVAQAQRADFLGEGAFRIGALGDGKLGGRLVEHGAEYKRYRCDRRSRLESRIPAALARLISSRNGTSRRSRTV